MRLESFLSGGTFIASLAIAYFFYRFYKQRSDSLFLLFSLGFLLLGLERLVLIFVTSASEFHAYVYLIRLVAFSLIISGIISKNFSKKSGIKK